MTWLWGPMDIPPIAWPSLRGLLEAGAGSGPGVLHGFSFSVGNLVEQAHSAQIQFFLRRDDRKAGMLELVTRTLVLVASRGEERVVHTCYRLVLVRPMNLSAFFSHH